MSRCSSFLLSLLWLSQAFGAGWRDPEPNGAYEWTFRAPLIVQETKGVTRTAEPLIVKLSDLFGYRFDFSKLSVASLRVVDTATGGTVPHRFEHRDLGSGATSDDEIIFRVSIEAGAKVRLCVYASGDAAIPALPSPPELDLNLAPNPSFEHLDGEARPVGWRKGVIGQGRASIDTAAACDGKCSLLASGDSESAAYWLSDFIPVEPNTTYELLAFIKTTPEFGSPKVKLTGYDADRKHTGEVVDGYGSTTREWRIYTINEAARRGSTDSRTRYVRIQLLKAPTRQGSVCFDALSLRRRTDLEIEYGDVESREKRAESTKVCVHPRLLLSPDDLPALRARALAGKDRGDWKDLRATAAREYKSGHPYSESECLTATRSNCDLFLARNGRAIRALAWLWLVEEDPKVGEQAKARLLDFCTFKRWVAPWYAEKGLYSDLATGAVAESIAYAYDLLYPLLHPAERHTVRKAILSNAVRPAYRDYVIANQRGDGRSNWVGVVVGGVLKACLAIWEDDPAVQAELAFYFDALKRKYTATLDAIDDDGAWGEGLAYLDYGFSRGVSLMEELRRVTGEDWRSHPRWQKVPDFLAYTLTPDRTGYVDFGDSGYATVFSAARQMAHEINSPLLAWIDEVQLQRPKSQASPSLRDLIGYSDAIQPRSPEGTYATSKLFRNIGWAIMRTGWQPDDALLAFKCSPTLWPHKHPDECSFMFSAYGERLLVDGGHPGAYTNPKFKSWYDASISHNVVFVDGQGQASDRPDCVGRIVHFYGSEAYDEVVADSPGPYEGRLRTFRRRLIFMKPDYVVLLDHVVPTKTDASIEWLFHAPGDRSIGISPDQGCVTITRPKASLEMTFVSPAGLAFSVRQGEPLMDYPLPSDKCPSSYLCARAQGEQHLLCVMQPLRPGIKSRRVTSIPCDGALGLRVESSEWTDLLLFSLSGKGIDADGVLSDAKSCAVRVSQDGVVQRGAMHDGARLSYRGQSVFSANERCSKSFAKTP